MAKTFKEPPQDIQDEMKEKRNKLIVMFPSLNIEIKGWWIWIDGDTKPYKESLKTRGCFYSSKTEKWYWKHPDAPNSRRQYSRRQWKNKSAKRTAAKVDAKNGDNPVVETNKPSKSKPSIRASLEDVRSNLKKELLTCQDALRTDSGENHINIQREITRIENDLFTVDKSLEDLENAAKAPAPEPVKPVKPEPELEKIDPEEARKQLQDIFRNN